MPKVIEEPNILAFVCNWCAYAGADLAGVSRMQYPTNVRLIRLMCTGRVNHGFLLKAFLKGGGRHSGVRLTHRRMSLPGR